MSTFEQARAWLGAARRVVALTGAGISAESGIPTFRGPGGLWKQFRPEELATPQAFARDPALGPPLNRLVVIYEGDEVWRTFLGGGGG